jgi:competence protein ComEA
MDKKDLSFLFEAEKPLSDKLSAITPFLTKKPILITGLIGLSFLALALVTSNRSEKKLEEPTFVTSEASPTKSVIHVDIEGAVERPGLKELKSGDRVEELLKMSGGMTEEADENWIAKNLNRAKVLKDGDKIYIPRHDEVKNTSQITNQQIESSANDVMGVSSSQININTAGATDLDKLPGIGTVTVGKIIAGRPYDKIDDLLSRKILSKSVYEKVKNLIVAE